jgi:hypothetical protein
MVFSENPSGFHPMAARNWPVIESHTRKIQECWSLIDARPLAWKPQVVEATSFTYRQGIERLKVILFRP